MLEAMSGIIVEKEATAKEKERAEKERGRIRKEKLMKRLGSIYYTWAGSIATAIVKMYLYPRMLMNPNRSDWS
jgi:hypothetical protein